jgi:hypothetical protein
MDKEVKQRTPRQNKALHLYFTHLAAALTASGLDMRRTLKPEIDIPWSTETVKEYLFRPIMQAQLGKKSTTELSTKEIDDVFDTLNKHLGEKFGLHVEFPCLESIINQLRANEGDYHGSRINK